MCSVIKSCLTLCDPMGPWDFPGKNTGMGCHFLLKGIFLIMGLNLCLLHWKPLLYCWDTREAHVCVLLWTLYKCYTCYFETYIFFFKDNCSFLLTWMGLVNLFLMHYTINISLSENIAIYSSIFLLISIYVNIIFFLP